MDWSDLLQVEKVDVIVVHIMLLGQVIFVLLWGRLPWWREWIGRALMTKSTALAILIAANLVLFWYLLITNKEYKYSYEVRLAVNTLVTLGIWSQVVALVREMRIAHNARRQVRGLKDRKKKEGIPSDG